MLACANDPYVVNQFLPDVLARALINRVIPIAAFIASIAFTYWALDFCRLLLRHNLVAFSNT
jgi:hypothetical protein